MSAPLAAIADAFEQGAGRAPCRETLHSLQRRLAGVETTNAIMWAFLAGLLDRLDLDAAARAAVEGRY